MNAKAQQKIDTQATALEALHDLIQPGDLIYTVLKHRSASGMSRRISLLIARPAGAHYDGKLSIRNIDWLVGKALDRKVHDNGGVVIGGCGMDMGFALVYDLGKALWPNGTEKAHGIRNGEPDTDGGYALQQGWL